MRINKSSSYKSNLTPIVKISINEKPSKFLIDTDASISIMKPHLLRKEQIQPSKAIEIIGVDGDTSFTNGIYTSFSKFKFHVTNNQIKRDGILGYD